jgi:pantoate ligase/cytidylate kinase
VRVLTTVEGLRCYLAERRQTLSHSHGQCPTVGLVPTMGGLHNGHLSLIEKARKENDVVVTSIFVNPLQFAPGEDLDKYPRTESADLQQCQQGGVDAVFMPTPKALYGIADPAPGELTQVIPPKEMMAVLCGPYRPGHFEGVATVVTKLLCLVTPDRAYFGCKDAQQLAILKRLAKDLYLPGTLVGCPTVRESDGLALSSRNTYLTARQRQQATVIYRGLLAAQQRFQAGEHHAQELVAIVKQILSHEPEVQPQYVEVVHPETLEPLDQINSVGLLGVAAYVGSTRLIDNIILRHRQPILAIDGPAGAGKSTVARQVAQRLNLLYLDSGAMYRAVTWLALQRGIPPQDEIAVAELLPELSLQLAPAGDEPEFAAYPSRIWLNGQEVTQLIRTTDVTAHVSTIAAQPAVRQALLRQQQHYGANGGIVMEGRDIGTHVFPHAELKIFLTASVAERARRRQRDLQAQQQATVSLEDLERAIDERDRKDSTRQIAPLTKAADAVELNTDGLSIEAVVDKIVTLYHQQNQSVASPDPEL